jgi:DNA-binding MarR family transcriptional regulator
MAKDFSALFLENQLCFPLYASARLTSQIYEPHLKKLDLTYAQYLVLLVLWKEKELTVNEIGKKLVLESNTLTPLLKRLEQKEIIARQRSSADERKVMISLTSKGKALKQQAVHIPALLINQLGKASITHKEMVQFQKTLQKLLHVLHPIE